MTCEIKVTEAARNVTVQVAVPTARRDLQPLVEALVALLPPP